MKLNHDYIRVSDLNDVHCLTCGWMGKHIDPIKYHKNRSPISEAETWKLCPKCGSQGIVYIEKDGTNN